MTPAALLVQRAAERGLRIAVAESLTGGLLAASIVTVPGASRVFSGGIVAYDTALKHSILGVDSTLLQVNGPVHRDVALQMAEGARRVCATQRDGDELAAADIGISTTGVAGPDPDPQSGQVAGTVWVAVSTAKNGSFAYSLSGLGGLDRDAIRQATVEAALEQAIQCIAA